MIVNIPPRSESGNDEYDALPAGVRAHLSLYQYLWMTDEQKAHLIHDLTEPENDE